MYEWGGYLISDHHCYLYITLKELLCAGSDSFMSGIKKKQIKYQCD